MNGNLSSPIQNTRGVRQGCPLSALLYILVAETLAEKIRSNPLITGIPIPGCPSPTKISGYADDATLILRKLRSIENALADITIFERASGAELNKTKTKVFPLGRLFGTANKNIPSLAVREAIGIQWILPDWLGSDDDYNGIPHVKLLGTDFCHELETTAHHSFSGIYKKFKDRIKPLKGRSLSLRGRVIAGNTLLSSKLWHTASVLPLPSSIEVNLRTKLFAYIWSRRKTNPIKQEILYRPFHLAGLQLLEIKTQSQALLTKQVNDVINRDDFSPATCFARFHLAAFIRPHMPPTITTFLESRRIIWSIEEPPPYYKDIKDTCISLHAIWNKPSEPPSVKQIYTALLTLFSHPFGN